jgi:class I lanthipeptide synthase
MSTEPADRPGADDPGTPSVAAGTREPVRRDLLPQDASAPAAAGLDARDAAAPSGWLPLLEGSLAASAWESIQGIARALDGPQEFRGPEHSLVEGRAGLAVFFGYLAMATGDDRASEQAFRTIETIIESVGEGQANPGFLFGFPGIAWTVEHLEGRICEPGENDLSEGVDEALLEALSSAPEGGWYGGHDLMFGLVGLGVYALERLPRPSGREILRLVIDKLEAMSEQHPEGLAWPSSPSDMPPEIRAKYPNGVYSLGVSHGSPGIIGFLGRAYAAGIERRTVRRLLPRAVAWLLSQRLEGGRGSSFANWVSSGPDSGPTRSSWCYGNVGIAPALMTAGRCAGERAWEEVALELAVEAAERPFEDSGVMDGGLCHGAAGVGHLMNRVFQATGDERVRDAARFWFETTLEMRRSGQGLAGYLSYREAPGDREPSLMTDPGVLTGIAGIGLALLAAVTPVEPAWDRVFLAAIPPASR